MPTDNPLIRQAIEAIDRGDLALLGGLLAGHPWLVRHRLPNGEEGYFKDPYLLWFVADNPIRNGTLPSNILDVTRFLAEAVKREAPDSAAEQLGYTLALVATGRIPRECGVQIALIDLLIDAGAKPGASLGALAHGNVEAAAHLVERGDTLTLAAAVCLERRHDAAQLAAMASPAELRLALTAAAFYAKPHMVSFLLDAGADPNGYPDASSGFHTHATPLHQAVYAASLPVVKMLVEAGARLDMTDKAYGATPLGWAQHAQTGEEESDDLKKARYRDIELYLLHAGAATRSANDSPNR